MKSVTVRDLRNNFGRISRWLAAGEEVDITKNGKLFAHLRAATPEKVEMPDFLARAKEIFGDRVFTAEETAQMIRDSRGERF
jgi:antitoxin (DNA-binding transcriptional repressor) of toxin-antitoxin stability system